MYNMIVSGMANRGRDSVRPNSKGQLPRRNSIRSLRWNRVSCEPMIGSIIIAYCRKTVAARVATVAVSNCDMYHGLLYKYIWMMALYLHSAPRESPHYRQAHAGKQQTVKPSEGAMSRYNQLWHLVGREIWFIIMFTAQGRNNLTSGSWARVFLRFNHCINAR